MSERRKNFDVTYSVRPHDHLSNATIRAAFPKVIFLYILGALMRGCRLTRGYDVFPSCS